MYKLKASFFFIIFSFTALDIFAQVDTAWVRLYNGPLNSTDYSNALTVDDSGNVYVTGYSASGVTGYDYATIKYAPNGDSLWVRRYNGPESGVDEAYALAVDSNGNVYVTGESEGSESFLDFDYNTVKYAPNGDTLWVRRYNGPGNGNDYASALAVDESGNVYVTGISWSGTSSDYVTIKYDLDGDTLWVRRYNGPGNGGDKASALALDGNGNVYVTGYSTGDQTYADYATIKYSPAGETLWVRRYNGPKNYYDYANALVLDNNGNVYVTGASYQSSVYPLNSDYATIKYAPNGDTLWVRRYNGVGNGDDIAYALAVDETGNVYVTGYSWDGRTSYDYATIKYTSNGDTLWVRRYNGPGDYLSPNALALDSMDNVYVTGKIGTIKYSTNGDILWFSFYGGRNIALDSSNNVYVTGGEENYLTVKYVQFACTAKSGDPTGNGNISPADIVYLINYYFKAGPAPSLVCMGDANADGGISPADIVYLINYYFKGRAAPLKSRECCL